MRRPVVHDRHYLDGADPCHGRRGWPMRLMVRENVPGAEEVEAIDDDGNRIVMGLVNAKMTDFLPAWVFKQYPNHWMRWEEDGQLRSHTDILGPGKLKVRPAPPLIRTDDAS